MLETINKHNATNLCREQYAPRINKLTMNKNINNLHLRNKIEKYSARSTRSSTYPLPPRVPHPIYIPTSKSSINDHSALLYRNEVTPNNGHIPIDDIVNESKTILPRLPGNTKSTDDVFSAKMEEHWDEMLHKTTSVINITQAKTQQSLKHNTSFKFCTDLVQNNTGVNRNVTINKSCIHAYEDTAPFLIGWFKRQCGYSMYRQRVPSLAFDRRENHTS